MNTFSALKQRHRDERDNYPSALALRTHRALSWLKKQKNVLMTILSLHFYGSLLTQRMHKTSSKKTTMESVGFTKNSWQNLLNLIQRSY